MGERLILASASPTRARLLAAAGIDFTAEPAEVDETAVKRRCRAAGISAADCALTLAEAKARAISQRDDRALVIGADQILVCGDVWFDKPVDIAEARSHLRALEGRTHELATAACAVLAGARLWRAVSAPKLRMRRFGDMFLDGYLAAEGPAALGSVGGYRLEGRGVQLFDHIEGDHFSILGLPLLELIGFLRERGALAS